MGANISAETQTIANSSPTKKSKVIAFHSSATWKIHFEAVKQTNTLVRIHFKNVYLGKFTIKPNLL